MVFRHRHVHDGISYFWWETTNVLRIPVLVVRKSSHARGREACVRSYRELPPAPGTNYFCFVDAASGVPNGDSFAIVISHRLGDRVVFDAIREIEPPFSPTMVVQSILMLLCKSYAIQSIKGDNYAGEYPKELVRAVGISYELADKHKSDLYIDPFLSLLNSNKIDLPKNDRAISQICALERSVQRSGRDQISHPSFGHDDVANAIAGAAYLAHSTSSFDASFSWVDGIDQPIAPAPVGETVEQRQRREQSESNYRWRHDQFFLNTFGFLP